MSYQVLARKWRPHTFKDLVGQEHVVQALVNGLDQDRVHHAFLLTGTRGVGKTTIARILAKCLNCEKGKQRDRMVIGNFCGSVVARTNFTCGGGSSSVLSNALKLWPDNMWTSSMI